MYSKCGVVAVLRIRIRRIHMFLGLLDPDPDPLVKGTDPDPSIIKQKLYKNLYSYCFVTSFDFLRLKNDLQKVLSRKTFFKLVFCWRLEGQ
jgi:hypothetical protein